MFIEKGGTNIDLSGQNVTKACLRAVENAIHDNSMPGIKGNLPSQALHSNDKTSGTVSMDKEKVHLDLVKKEIPCGEVTIANAAVEAIIKLAGGK